MPKQSSERADTRNALDVWDTAQGHDRIQDAAVVQLDLETPNAHVAQHLAGNLMGGGGGNTQGFANVQHVSKTRQ